MQLMLVLDYIVYIFDLILEVHQILSVVYESSICERLLFEGYPRHHLSIVHGKFMESPLPGSMICYPLWFLGFRDELIDIASITVNNTTQLLKLVVVQKVLKFDHPVKRPLNSSSPVELEIFLVYLVQIEYWKLLRLKLAREALLCLSPFEIRRSIVNQVTCDCAIISTFLRFYGGFGLLLICIIGHYATFGIRGSLCL